MLVDVSDFGLTHEGRFTACQVHLDTAFPFLTENGGRELIDSEPQTMQARVDRLGRDDDTVAK